jgi:hypothetical protein
MYCVQIKGDGDICGTVTGIGVLFELAVQGDLRLGLYDDGAGSPTTRLGQSADIHLDGVASVDAALEQPALIPCEPRIHAVWVCLASSAGSMKLKAIPNSTSNWAEMDAHAAMIADWLDSGVPDSWSGTALFPASVTPNVYLWIAP